MSRCPRCTAALDEGPVVYRCAHCQRAVWAAELDTEFHVPAFKAGAGFKQAVSA